MGLLTLAPHGKGRLALLILGNSVEGLMDVVSLATPTIPPMTRSPVGIHVDKQVTVPHARAKNNIFLICNLPISIIELNEFHCTLLYIYGILQYLNQNWHHISVFQFAARLCHHWTRLSVERTWRISMCWFLWKPMGIQKWNVLLCLLKVIEIYQDVQL